MDDEKPISDLEMAQDIMREYLHARDLRVTPERRAIVEIVFELQGHFTTEDVRASLVRKRFRVSLATLYNNMDMLTETGIITRYMFGSTMRYERRIGVPPHFHRVCSVCEKVEDLENERLMRLVEKTPIKGFKPDYYQFFIYGICNRCAAALRRKNKKAIKK